MTAPPRDALTDEQAYAIVTKVMTGWPVATLSMYAALVRAGYRAALAAAPAPPAAPPAEPPATDADRIVHDLQAIAIDFAGDHQVDHTCFAAADLIERQAREIAEAKRSEEHTRAVFRVAERDYRERLARAEAERDALRALLHDTEDKCMALRECVRAADAMRTAERNFPRAGSFRELCDASAAYDAARAKVQG